MAISQYSKGVSCSFLQDAHMIPNATTAGNTSSTHVIRSKGVHPEPNKPASHASVRSLSSTGAIVDVDIFIADIGVGQSARWGSVLHFFSFKTIKFSIQAMPILQINGKHQQVPSGSNLEKLIVSLQLEGKRFAIELNGEIVPRSRHAATTLHDNDMLEVVVAVGGG